MRDCIVGITDFCTVPAQILRQKKRASEEPLVKRVIAGSVPHYLQALHAVARSDFIAAIPERLIRAYAVPLHLKWLPLTLDAGTFDEFLPLSLPQSSFVLV
jgi:hypothetical protein